MFFNYSDKNLCILIDKDPDIKALATDKKEYLVTQRPVNIQITSKKSRYNVFIDAGFSYDGMTFIEGKVTGKTLIASFLHDAFCKDHAAIGHNRKLSSEVFRACLIAYNVPVCLANLECFLVDFFQRFRGW